MNKVEADPGKDASSQTLIPSKRSGGDPYNNSDMSKTKESFGANNKESLKQRIQTLYESTGECLGPLNKICTEVHITDGLSQEVKSQHYIRQIEVQSQKEIQVSSQTAIKHNDIFKLSTESGEPRNTIRSVMTTGIAGIGKSIMVHKFILDWVEGIANHDIEFVLQFHFGDLNLLKDKKFSLQSLILHFYPELTDIVCANVLNQSKILFIFDGLDESNLPLNFRDGLNLSDITETCSVDMLIVNLIRGLLLPSALIWITARPAAAGGIPSYLIQRWTEIWGFSDQHKLECFKKTVKNESDAVRLLKEIKDSKGSRSLYIMCRIPIVCHIVGTLLTEMPKEAELPKTLTEVFAHFVLIQMTGMNLKCDESKLCRQEILESKKDAIIKMGALAFTLFERGETLISMEELKICGIDVDQDFKLLNEELLFHSRKFYRFVHPSVQEFLAALYVFQSLVNGDFDALKSFPIKGRQLHDLKESVVKKSMQSENGHLDLFIRFFLGISLESNLKLFKGLLGDPQESSGSVKSMVQCIKDTISYYNKSTERCMNLLLCLCELKDCSLYEEVHRYVESVNMLSPTICSMLAYMSLVSGDIQDLFDLSKYNTTDKGRGRLIIAVWRCRKARLVSCGLKKEACEVITSVLQSDNSTLKELNLSCNDLRDVGIQVLSQGLCHKNCNLKILRLASCNLKACSCKTLATILQSSESCLRELDLTNNDLSDNGVQELSPALCQPSCRLHTLILAGCNLTGQSCTLLAAALQSGNSHLMHLDLTNNDLGEAGIDGLSAGLGHQNCKLEILKLSGCLVTEGACEVLASVLSSNPSHLKILNLSYNHTERLGISLRSQLQSNGCQLNIDHNADCWMKPGLQKYACDLTLDKETAHPELILSENNKKVTRVDEEQLYPDYPHRFDGCPQLLCTEGLTGRHYWEAEWSGSEAVIGVAYKSIRRKAHGADCKIGLNVQSYGLWCEGSHYSVRYDKNKTDVPAPSPGCKHIGVYLDWPAGVLSFYAVSSGKLTHLHTFHSQVGDPPRPGFSEPLYPGFWLHWNSTVILKQATSHF